MAEADTDTDQLGCTNRAVWAVLGLFWNRGERRLRALWRLALAMVLFGVLSVAIGTAFQVLAIRSIVLTTLAPTMAEPSASVVLRVLSLLVTAIGTTLAVWIGTRFLDRRPLADLGVGVDRGWWLDFGFGLALGAALMTAIFLVELAAGWITVTSFFPSPLGAGVGTELFAAVVLFLAVGIYEELAFRGYLLTNAAEGLTGVPLLTPRRAIGLATVLTAGLFGAVHANNPNATLLSTMNIASAGIFLAAGYVLSGDLAIPIGLHITWNLVQGTIFGFPVSGTAFGTSVIRVRQSGPPVLTGGTFGPEAGLLGLSAMVLGTIAIAAWVRARYGTIGLYKGIAVPELRWR
ncbi:CPBP family intramembrane metalloprotease domain-containing protein [Halobacteriales archaeon QS_3_64_16]|nr:MAG: CPBP family intramembrane metalloprotease domain-containing protein [Halobacteriales archaeon QS_3_64_16]